MGIKVLTIQENILGANEEKAASNQELFSSRGILVVNIMSSPGAGKTSLLLNTINNLQKDVRMAVIEGDVASSVDAEKINELGIPVVQINTAGGCHLDAYMIERACNDLPQDNIDLLFIENVGNLICPAEFALGEHKKVMILSLPEGDDKPHKYPLMFTEADVVLLNKIDLMPYLDFDVAAFSKDVTGLNPTVRILPVSARTGEGLQDWFSWLKTELAAVKGSK